MAENPLQELSAFGMVRHFTRLNWSNNIFKIGLLLKKTYGFAFLPLSICQVEVVERKWEF